MPRLDARGSRAIAAREYRAFCFNLGAPVDRQQFARAMARAATPTLVVTGLVVAFAASFVVRRVALSVANPRVALENLEGAAFLSTAAWMQGGWQAMYPTSFADPGGPFVITPYPPLFHALWRSAARVLRDYSTYVPGRVVAILALAAIVALVYACARRAGASRLKSALFAELFLLPVPVVLWAGVARVDVLGIALSLAGLWLYLRYRAHQGHWYLVSAVPIVLAGLTKQSLIAAPAAIVLAELTARRYRRAAVFAACTAAPVLAAYLVLNRLTDGGFFDATVTSLADQVFLSAGVVIAADFLTTDPMMLVLLVLTLSLWRLASSEVAVLPLYAATACAMLALTIGKPGANLNYFIEPIAALCVCAAAGLGRWRERHVTGSAVTPVVAGVLIWAALSLVPGYREAYRLQRRTIERSGIIRLPPEALSGPVLVPTSLVLLVEPRPVYYLNDDYTFGVLAAWDKLVSTERIAGDLRHHRVSAVVVRPEAFQPREDGPTFIGDWQRGWNFWSVDEFRNALLEAYAPVDREYPLGVLLLLPRAPADTNAGVAPRSP